MNDKCDSFFGLECLFGTLWLLTKEENQLMVDRYNWITSAKFSWL